MLKLSMRQTGRNALACTDLRGMLCWPHAHNSSEVSCGFASSQYVRSQRKKAQPVLSPAGDDAGQSQQAEIPLLVFASRRHRGVRPGGLGHLLDKSGATAVIAVAAMFHRPYSPPSRENCSGVRGATSETSPAVPRVTTPPMSVNHGQNTSSPTFSFHQPWVASSFGGQ